MPAPAFVTGASGYLGHAVLAAAGDGRAVVRAGRGDGCEVALDLDRPDAAAAALRAARPAVVLHLAAMSRMADCERDPDAARRANAVAAGALAVAAREVGARFVHVSTDLVFGGDAAPYAADATPQPRSVYGRSKADGERAVLDAGGVVVRVPLLFGPSFDGRRGATDMLRAALRDQRAVALFVDEFRTPLHVADAARLLWTIADLPAVGSVLHLAGPERVSRHELGERFRAIAGLTALEIDALPNPDPTRPADVSLRADLPAGRSLDAMLAAC